MNREMCVKKALVSAYHDGIRREIYVFIITLCNTKINVQTVSTNTWEGQKVTHYMKYWNHNDCKQKRRSCYITNLKISSKHLNDFVSTFLESIWVQCGWRCNAKIIALLRPKLKTSELSYISNKNIQHVGRVKSGAGLSTLVVSQFSLEKNARKYTKFDDRWSKVAGEGRRPYAARRSLPFR